MTGHAYLLKIEGLFTQGSRLGRTFGESVGGILKVDSSDWSKGILKALLRGAATPLGFLEGSLGLYHPQGREALYVILFSDPLEHL